MAKEGTVVVNVLGKVTDLANKLKASEANVQVFAKGSAAALKDHLGSAIDSITSRFGQLGQAGGDKLKALANSAVDAGGTMGVAIGAGAAAGLAAVVELGIKGISSFVNLAGEVRSFQRIAGDSAEDASKLVAVLKDVGIDAATGAAGVFKLNRQIAQHSDVLKADGIEIARNKDGSVDLSNTLLNVGDAYKAAGGGSAGATVAFDAFGKSGAALIPILGLSREKLQEFYAAAAAHGEILSQQDLDKAKQFKLSLHDLSEALGGLERSIGSRAVPFLATMAQGVAKITDKVTELSGHLHGVNIAKNFFEALPGVGQLGSALELVAGKSHKAAVSTDEVKNALEQEAQAADDATQALDDLLSATLAQFDDNIGYQRAVLGTKDSIDAYTKSVKASGSASEDTQKAFLDAEQAVLSQAAAAAKAADDQANLAGKTLTAADEATIQKNELQKVADALAPGSALRQALDAYIAQLEKIPATVATSVIFQTPSGKTGAATTGSTGGIDRSYIGGAKASGGPVSAGVPYLVGEKGPEIVVPAAAGNVVPNSQIGGNVYNLNFIDKSKKGFDAADILWKIRRLG